MLEDPLESVAAATEPPLGAAASFHIVTANVLTLHPAEERKGQQTLHARRREALAAEFASRRCDIVGIQKGLSS